MRNSFDFLERLDKDMSMKIFSCLEDPSDLVRASAVSTSWRRFVIENDLCKQLCLKMCPELSYVIGVVALSEEPATIDIRTHNFGVPSLLERDHRVFAFLGCALTQFPKEDYIVSDAISASSTDHFSDEDVANTLDDDYDMVERSPTYWSSKGESDPEVPETLVYKLLTNLSLVSEIRVQPFEAYFEVGCPIYSAKAVRFSLGRLISPESASDQIYADDMFIWTYTSPVYPMAQDPSAQEFRLPRPVLCMGGILKVELLGRAQKEEIDGLYYLCVNHVQAAGRSLGPSFDIDVVDHTGRFILKYDPKASYFLPTKKKYPPPSASQSFTSALTNRN